METEVLPLVEPAKELIDLVSEMATKQYSRIMRCRCFRPSSRSFSLRDIPAATVPPVQTVRSTEARSSSVR